MIDINGMAHVILTVSQYDKAKAFYARLMPAMGLETVFDNEGLTYFVGARTAVGIPSRRPNRPSGCRVDGLAVKSGVAPASPAVKLTVAGCCPQPKDSTS